MLLQVVPLARDVRRHFHPVGEANARDLAERRVRLLRRGGVDASADAALLRAGLERRRSGLALLLVAAGLHELIDRRHLVLLYRSLAKTQLSALGHTSPREEAGSLLNNRVVSRGNQEQTASQLPDDERPAGDGRARGRPSRRSCRRRPCPSGTWSSCPRTDGRSSPSRSCSTSACSRTPTARPRKAATKSRRRLGRRVVALVHARRRPRPRSYCRTSTGEVEPQPAASPATAHSPSNELTHESPDDDG